MIKKHLYPIFFAAMVIGGSSLVAQAESFFKVGETAPDFSLTGLNGQNLSLQQFKGQVVVLGLFHICQPCLVQSTNLQRVHESTKGKPVAVIGVNSSGDSRADVMEFLQTFPVKITYPYLLDPKQETDELYGGGRFIPNVYVIDQNGQIRWQRVGNFPTDGTLAGHEAILREVEKLLQEAPASSSM
jgi:cytochrome c biogenesis protein CcmG, thiol:disulfide interchange protein DsbE